CPKCNILKSNHWPCDKKQLTTPSHNNKFGFVDPFVENMSDYFSVNSEGILEPLKNPGPYMLEILDLNRLARVLSRKKRMQLNRVKNLLKTLDEKTDELFTLIMNDKISKELASEKYNGISKLRESLRDLLS
ncbi:hypothetical protein ACUNGP_27750, partial [Serratia sp. IR-2025]